MDSDQVFETEHPLNIHQPNPLVSFVDDVKTGTVTADLSEKDDERHRKAEPAYITASVNSGDSNGTFEKLRRLKSRLRLKDLSQNELELKASIYFHICNPLKRWKVEKLVPYKLVLQVVKTFLLVAQVVLFTYVAANDRAVFVFQTNFLFQELFIKAYSSQDAKPSNHFSAQTREDVLDEISFAVERHLQYYQLPSLTVGCFGYHLANGTDRETPPLVARLLQFKVAELNPSTEQYRFDFNIETDEFYLESENVSNMSFAEQLVLNGLDLSFSRFVKLELKFAVKSIRLSHFNDFSELRPECIQFDTTLTYKRSAQHVGVKYYLTNDVGVVGCEGDQEMLSKPASSYTKFIIILTLLDLVITLLCMVSILFTVHTYHRAYKLGKAMGDFYRSQLNIDLSWWERKSLFSGWLVFTFFSDVMLILGSLLKILSQYNVLLDVVAVRILLGTALVVQAGAIMRYFSFFRQLNALTRTLSAAYPELLKFLLCTSLLYCAFAVCGLVVFGSYGELFGNFGNSVEILFALINGDSIWLVFRAFDSHNIAIYVYSRFFVYLFIFLFIYAVLNLFTSLVKTSYDESSNVDRAMINEVRRFVFSGPLTPNGVALRDVTHVQKYVEPKVILRHRSRRHKESIGDLD